MTVHEGFAVAYPNIASLIANMPPSYSQMANMYVRMLPTDQLREIDDILPQFKTAFENGDESAVLSQCQQIGHPELYPTLVGIMRDPEAVNGLFG